MQVQAFLAGVGLVPKSIHQPLADFLQETVVETEQHLYRTRVSLLPPVLMPGRGNRYSSSREPTERPVCKLHFLDGSS